LIVGVQLVAVAAEVRLRLVEYQQSVAVAVEVRLRLVEDHKQQSAVVEEQLPQLLRPLVVE
jgi:hypothetical protein